MCSKRKHIFKIKFQNWSYQIFAIVAKNVMSLKRTWINIPSILFPRSGTVEVRIKTFSYSRKMKMETIIYETLFNLANVYSAEQNIDKNL